MFKKQFFKVFDIAQKTFFLFVGLENIHIYMLEYIYMLDKSVANVDFRVTQSFIMKINMNESKYFMSA